MKSFQTLLFILAMPFVSGHQLLDARKDCKANHSCYTQTFTTKNTATDCPKLTNCGVHVDCFQMTTTTISAPAIDACCMSTPTFRVPGPCPTCQTGCNTGTETVFKTAGAYPTLYRDSLSPTCTTTKMVLKQMHIGPTETVYTSAVTSTSTLACDGCALVTRNWAGIGPVAHFTTTVTATGATTTTTFVCTK